MDQERYKFDHRTAVKHNYVDLRCPQSPRYTIESLGGRAAGDAVANGNHATDKQLHERNTSVVAWRENQSGQYSKEKTVFFAHPRNDR